MIKTLFTHKRIHILAGGIVLNVVGMITKAISPSDGFAQIGQLFLVTIGSFGATGLGKEVKAEEERVRRESLLPPMGKAE